MKPSNLNEAFQLHLATMEDVPGLEVLIPLSVRSLQAPYYSAAQMEAALGPVFGVDRQLIRDGTYFAVEHSGQVIGCGGWSRRRAVFGGDRARDGEDTALDPAHDSARIRAFFVHPDWARRGIGRAILIACETAIRSAGFRDAVLVATLAGEPLYAACGYSVAERYEVRLSNGLTLPVVRMVKNFTPNEQDRKVTGLNHLTLSVGALERSVVFYRELLGFSLRMRTRSSAYLEAGTLWLALVLDSEVKHGPLAEYSHIAFSVTAVALPILADRLQGAGVVCWQEAERADSFYFLDPDGHKLELHSGDLRSRLQSRAAIQDPDTQINE